MSQTSPSLSELARTLRVIADESRLRILGLVAEQERTGRELGEALKLTPATVSHHMRKLVDAGIVTATPEAQSQRYSLNLQFLAESRRMPVEEQVDPVAGSESHDPIRSRTISNFFEGDRLKAIPSRRKARVIVLQHLLRGFQPDRDYPESEVNEMLGRAHEDFATLRREMVDYGFMTRDNGIYRISRSPPERSRQVAQEILGDENEWLQGLLRATITSANDNRENT